jgi:hypothetical protein
MGAALCGRAERLHSLLHAVRCKRSPDTATLADVRRFQLHLADTGVITYNRNRIMTGLRFFFRVIGDWTLRKRSITFVSCRSFRW